MCNVYYIVYATPSSLSAGGWSRTVTNVADGRRRHGMTSAPLYPPFPFKNPNTTARRHHIRRPRNPAHRSPHLTHRNTRRPAGNELVRHSTLSTGVTPNRALIQTKNVSKARPRCTDWKM